MIQPSRRRQRRRRPAAPSQHRGSLRLALVLAVLVGVNLYVFLWRGDTSIPAVMEQAAMAGHKGEGMGPAAEAVDGLGPADPDRALPEQAEAEGRMVEAEVESGDSMGGILRREGMTPPEADELIRILRDHMDLRKIRPGQTYRLHFDDDGRLTSFEFQVSRTLTVRVERDADGGLVGQQDETPTEVRVDEISGRVDSSLHAALKANGEDTALVSFFVDVFAYDLNFYTDTHEGDSFRMLVEKEYAEGEFLRYRQVLAAEYSGKAGTFHAFWWQVPGEDEGRYFDAEGYSVERSLLKTPLKFTRISSKFNPNRMHPVLHRRRGHMGVDYAAPTGTPVWAATDGRIVARGWHGGAGNCVIIKHDNGLQTVYMHLSKFRKGQKVGERVKGKTVIGYVGATGLATGPHLHFGVKQNGRYIDPLTLKMSRGARVARRHREQFLNETGRLVERLGRIALPGEGEAVAQTSTR